MHGVVCCLCKSMECVASFLFQRSSSSFPLCLEELQLVGFRTLGEREREEFFSFFLLLLRNILIFDFFIFIFDKI